MKSSIKNSYDNVWCPKLDLNRKLKLHYMLSLFIKFAFYKNILNGSITVLKIIYSPTNIGKNE